MTPLLDNDINNLKLLGKKCRKADFSPSTLYILLKEKNAVLIGILLYICKKDGDSISKEDDKLIDWTRNFIELRSCDCSWYHVNDSIVQGYDSFSKDVAQHNDIVKPKSFQTVLVLDGTDVKIDIPYSKEINPPTFTVEMWVMFQGSDGYRSPLTARNGSKKDGCKGFLFYATPRSKWQFWIGNGKVGDIWIMLGGPGVQSNVWTHLAGVYNQKAQTVYFYVNGQEVDREIGIKYQPNNKQPLRIGAGNTENPIGNYFFNGKISEVRVWNVALTQDKIQANMSRRLIGAAKGLVGYWSLSEGSGNIARDRSKNSQNGTIYGEVNWNQSMIPMI